MGDIAVIGGGASGLAAAICASEAGARVEVLEAGKRIGKSILASGNGRCNWTNARVRPEAYANAAFVADAFRACPPRQVWGWFARLGLVWAEEGGGRRYPLSNKASTVLDVLRFRMEELPIRVRVESPVERVVRAGGVWRAEGPDGAIGRYDAVVVACGGGVSDGLLPDDVRFVPRRARLCPLQTDREPLRGLDNIRTRARATLLRDGAAAASERGEFQFRAYGVSGIAAFDLSRFARVGDELCMDFLPDIPGREVEAELVRRMNAYPERDAERLLAGAVLPAVARAVLRRAGIDHAAAPAPRDAARIARALKEFTLRVAGFEQKQAQVRQGGVAVGQVDPATMELVDAAGLFVTGEALDVDGPCGGYNLHWAWTCGLLAGRAAAAR